MKLIVRTFSSCNRHNYSVFHTDITITTVKTGKINENTFAVLFSESSWKQPFRRECRKLFDKFFFLSGFSLTNIHESQNCRRRGRAFL